MGKRGNGEGTIYYSEKLSKWVGQFTAGRKADGKLNRKSVYGNTRKEVKEKLNVFLVKAQEGTIVDKTNITVSILGKNILDTKLNTNIIKETSYFSLAYSLKKIQESLLGDLNIQKVTYKEIQIFYNSITNLSNSYIEKINIILNLIFDEALKRDYIYKSPMLGVIIPKSVNQTKEVVAFTIEEQKSLIKAMKNNKYKNIYTIAMFSGMRIGEILALKPEDINLELNEININRTLSRDKKGNCIIGKDTKTYNSKRNIPITELFKNEIIDSIQNITPNDENLIFTTRNNTLITPVNINKYFKTLCKSASINNSEVNMHMLRHTYATRCIESGMPSHVLQKLLGHKNISTTINTYTTIFNKYRNDEVNKSIDYQKMQLDLF